MNEMIFELTSIRTEISFYSFSQLRLILAFYEKNNLFRVNIPCKNNLKKEFLLNSIKIAREEFPSIDIIPHFSIQYEFEINPSNTINKLNNFLSIVGNTSSQEILLISGSQKRKRIDTLYALDTLTKLDNFSNNRIIKIYS